MKTAKLFALVTGMALVLTLHAADKKHLGGPKGGRFLDKTEPKAEFVVEKDKSVSINFYDAAGKPIPAANQQVTVIANTKAGPEKIAFDKKGDSLVSKTKLPEGDGYNIVVQLKQTPDAKPQNHRFKLDLQTCGECQRPEYACICDE
jgi:hypothetical protein